MDQTQKLNLGGPTEYDAPPPALGGKVAAGPPGKRPAFHAGTRNAERAPSQSEGAQFPGPYSEQSPEAYPDLEIQQNTDEWYERH